METHKEVPVAKPEIENVDLKALIEENKALKEQLTQQRKAKEESYVPKPLELSEYKILCLRMPVGSKAKIG